MDVYRFYSLPPEEIMLADTRSVLIARDMNNIRVDNYSIELLPYLTPFDQEPYVRGLPPGGLLHLLPVRGRG